MEIWSPWSRLESPGDWKFLENHQRLGRELHLRSEKLVGLVFRWQIMEKPEKLCAAFFGDGRPPTFNRKSL